MAAQLAGDVVAGPVAEEKPTAWITAIRENTTPTAPVALLLWSWPTK